MTKQRAIWSFCQFSRTLQHFVALMKCAVAQALIIDQSFESRDDCKNWNSAVTTDSHVQVQKAEIQHQTAKILLAWRVAGNSVFSFVQYVCSVRKKKTAQQLDERLQITALN